MVSNKGMMGLVEGKRDLPRKIPLAKYRKYTLFSHPTNIRRVLRCSLFIPVDNFVMENVKYEIRGLKKKKKMRHTPRRLR